MKWNRTKFCPPCPERNLRPSADENTGVPDHVMRIHGVPRVPTTAPRRTSSISTHPTSAPGHPGSRTSTKITAGLRDMLRCFPNTCHKDSVTNSPRASALPHPQAPGTRDMQSSISSSSHNLALNEVERNI